MRKTKTKTDTRMDTQVDSTGAATAPTNKTASRHTPGPWRLQWDYDDICAGVKVGARVMPPEPFTGPPIAHVASKKANAHLIAAAPDLLAALELVELHFKRNHASGNFQGDDEHEAWTAARAAIAKAEGR